MGCVAELAGANWVDNLRRDYPLRGHLQHQGCHRQDYLHRESRRQDYPHRESRRRGSCRQHRVLRLGNHQHRERRHLLLHLEIRLEIHLLRVDLLERHRPALLRDHLLQVELRERLPEIRPRRERHRLLPHPEIHLHRERRRPVACRGRLLRPEIHPRQAHRPGHPVRRRWD